MGTYGPSTHGIWWWRIQPTHLQNLYLTTSLAEMWQYSEAIAIFWREDKRALGNSADSELQ